MAPKLSFIQSAELVKSTIQFRVGKTPDLDAVLGAFLETPDDLAWFQTEIHTHLSRQGFRVKLENIPSSPDFTIHDIAQSISGLAGPTHTPDR